MSDAAKDRKMSVARWADQTAFEVYRTDHVLVLKQPEKKFSVLSYEEVAQRLQARPKK